MSDAVTVLRAGGILMPNELITAATAEKIGLAVAATILMKETGGGKNIYGHDTSVTAGTYTPGGPVTKANYLAYRTAMKAGKIKRNGVGPCQATSAQYQDTADLLGGCWDPVANMRSGFRGMGALINAYGVQGGAQRYNGSGPAAVAYGQDFLTRYNAWRTRLAGVSLPTQEDNDVGTPDDNASTLLARLLPDPYTPGHQMNVGDQLSWACAHAAYARDSAARVEAQVTALADALRKGGYIT